MIWDPSEENHLFCFHSPHDSAGKLQWCWWISFWLLAFPWLLLNRHDACQLVGPIFKIYSYSVVAIGIKFEGYIDIGGITNFKPLNLCEQYCKFCVQSEWLLHSPAYFSCHPNSFSVIIYYFCCDFFMVAMFAWNC